MQNRAISLIQVRGKKKTTLVTLKRDLNLNTYDAIVFFFFFFGGGGGWK